MAAAALFLPLAAATPASAAVVDLATSIAVDRATTTVGSPFTVSATVTNVGSALAGESQLFVYGSRLPTLSSWQGGSCSFAFGTLRCDLPPLAAGSSVTVTAVVVASASGTLNMTASVSSDEDYDPVDVNDTSDVTLMVFGPPVTVTLSASTPRANRGDAVRLTVRVTGPGGVPVSDASVELQVSVGGALVSSTTGLLTDDGGQVSTEHEIDSTATFLASTENSDEAGPATSNAVVVEVGFRVRTAVSPVAIPPGGSVALTATIDPATPGGRVVVEERYGTEAWRLVATVTQDAAGRIKVPLGSRQRVGTYALRVTRAAEGLFATGVGEARTVVTVTGIGPATAWNPIGGTRRQPEHWRSCTLGYRLNLRHAPAWAGADLREAMRRITQTTGIRFRFRGTTTAIPTFNSGVPRQRNQVVIAWGSGRQTRGLVGGGVAGVTVLGHDPGNRFHSGNLVLDSAFSRRAPAGFGAAHPLGLVLMHELGHLVGLEHASKAGQIMLPSGGSLKAAVWGAGDLTGLRKIGKVTGCR